jgi:hypothetical protein
MITALALVLAATLALLAIAIGTTAGAVKLPKSYLGDDWCLTMSMRNDTGAGRTMNYQRRSDCSEGDRFTVHADGMDFAPECRVRKIKKPRPPSDHHYEVFYRCEFSTRFLKIEMLLEDEMLSTVQIMQKGLG